MSSRLLASAVAVSLLAGTAIAQAQQTTTTTSTATTTIEENDWRVTKLMGLDVYNDAKEKVGDINEVLIDRMGNVKSVVIGVGGFLGMGERNVAVSMDQLRFSERPLNGSTTGSSASSANDWAPNHAMMTATKEQLKAMPEFKYPADE